MTAIPPEKMVPGRNYRVSYQVGAAMLHHEGRYVGREAAFDGDYVLFERLPFGSQPFEILVASIKHIEPLNGS